MIDADKVGLGLESVRSRIEAAAVAAGREPSSVRLVAVTKRLDADAVRAAYSFGQRDFGENYVQEAVAKIDQLRTEMPDARWHMIGRLQSNKAAVAVGNFALLHGVDSLSTVSALSKAACKQGRVVDALLQVRLGRRGDSEPGAQRSGIEADEAAGFLGQAAAHKGLRFVGLMGVADPDLEAGPQFSGLRDLSNNLAALEIEGAPLGELSMGMTGDLEEAVAAGATIVRIGTAIFGEGARG